MGDHPIKWLLLALEYSENVSAGADLTLMRAFTEATKKNSNKFTVLSKCT